MMTDAQFDAVMEKGLMQAKCDDSKPTNEVFASDSSDLFQEKSNRAIEKHGNE